MKVSELLSLSSFSGSSVIAGMNGMSKTVTSAMILEATDIEKWGREGQAILTGFFAIQALTEQELACFFEKLVNIGISCIIFKPERLYKTAPENVIQLCEDNNLPLIQLSREVKYEAVMLDILMPIMDDNSASLKRYFDMHTKMMELALKQPSIKQILQSLKDSIHHEISFCDMFHETIVTTKKERSEYVGHDYEELEAGKYTHHRYGKAIFHYKDAPDEEILVIAVPSTRKGSCYLLIHDGVALHHREDIMDIENAVSLLQIEIMKKEAIDQRVFMRNNNDVQLILEGKCSGRESILEILSKLGLDRFPLYQVLRISLQMDADDFAEEKTILSLRRAMRRNFKSTAFFETGHSITFLYNFMGETKGFKSESVHQVLNQLKTDPNIADFHYHAGLSRICTLEEISLAYKEAMDICLLFEGSKRIDECISYESIGLYKLFIDAGKDTKLESLIDGRLQKLRNDSPHLFEMLIILCENNLNVKKTAQILFLHPKTIHYRLERLKDEYGIDVHNTDDFMQILITGKILYLINEHP